MKGFWGIFLIVAGLLFLGQSFNVLNNTDLQTIFSFWPLALVLFGLWLIVKSFRFAWVVMAVGFILSVLFVYGAGFTNNPFFNRFGSENRRENRGSELKVDKIKAEMEEGVERVEAEVNTGAIKFRIDGKTENLIEGDLLSSFLDPDLETDIENGVAKIKLDTVSLRRRFFFQDFKNELSLQFNPDLPLDLRVSTGASELDFDLSELIISKLSLNAGASDINVKLGENLQNGAKATFEVGVSNIVIDVPSAVGVRVVSESGLTGQDFAGFEQRNGAYYSPGYDAAVKKIDVEFRAGASAIKINRY